MMHGLVMVATMALSLLPSAPVDDDELEFRWKKKKRTLDDVPEEIADRLADPLDLWAPWAQEREYIAYATDDGRVVFYLSKKEGQAKRYLEQIEDVRALVDERFLEGGDSDDVSERPKQTHEEAIALFEFRTEDDYQTALARLQEEYPYNSGTVAGLDRSSGFVLFTPMVGGWLKNASGVEQWKPMHELINRLTQLLIYQTFDKPPFWLLVGGAWHAEFALKKRIHSFPYRNEFVRIEEHSGWASSLRSRYKKRGASLNIGMLAEIGPGSFDSEAAGLSWGMVTFLHAKHPGALRHILGDLHAYKKEHRKGGRRPDEGEAPGSEQLTILEKYTSSECLKEAKGFFRKGCK